MTTIKTGAAYQGDKRCSFCVWAPEKKTMHLHLVHPTDKLVEMEQDAWGYFKAEVEGIEPGARYFLRPDNGDDYPDPASQYQPEGVHGPSEVVDHDTYTWQDKDWRGIPFKDLILYELHVGTFTEAGTFEAMIDRLDDLVETGINAIELLPVAQFPGERNWGYDGVYPYAVQNSYGGPEGLKKLVDACHAKGIAVFMDVVYNHLGPEGNYFSQFGPYFTDHFHTPWGDAINFSEAWSDPVREYFSDNPLHWFEHYHIDGLRLDAIHTIFDTSAVSFWELTYNKIVHLEQKLSRNFYMTAESDLNSPRVVQVPELGGFGFDAQWLDDFHHALYVLLDKKGQELYADFGQMQQLTKAYTDGFVHSGEYVAFRKKKHGSSSAGVPGNKFIVFNQNHDQVGNRVQGERLSLLVNFERLKLAAAAILLSPYVPMLFMGEEYAEEAPFLYFVSHSDKELIEAVQKGREEEFSGFNWDVSPPDPQDEKTFINSKLNWQKRKRGKHRQMLQWHQELIRLRRTNPILQNFAKNDVRANVLGQEGFVLHRQNSDGHQHLLCLFNFSEKKLAYTLPDYCATWQKLLDSKAEKWLQKDDKEASLTPETAKKNEKLSLPPLNVVVYQSTDETA